MIDFNKIKMLSDWVLLEKNQSTNHQLISLPDSVADNSPIARILKAGPNLPRSLGVGQIVLDGSRKWKKSHSIIDSKTNLSCYIAPWWEIAARIYEDKVIPIGRRVLVKRIFPKSSKEGVVTPDLAMSSLQSLAVEVVKYGLVDSKGFKTKNLPPIGSICHLAQWEMHQIEVGVIDRYHLIINEEDLEYYELNF